MVVTKCVTGKELRKKSLKSIRITEEPTITSVEHH